MPEFTPQRSPNRHFLTSKVWLETTVVGAIAIAGLYFGRDVLIPIAVAIVISFALSPGVSMIERAGVKRLPAVALTVLFAFAVIGGLGAVIGNQMADLAEDLPKYQTNITAKIRSVRDGAGDLRIFSRASRVLTHISDEIARPMEVPASSATSPSSRANTLQAPPTPVEVRSGPATPFQVLKEILEPLLKPLATGSIILVFVMFFLHQRDDIRSRFIRLLGTRDIHKTTVALDDAGGRLSRYLLTQVSINALFGLLIGAGLAIIGVPHPVLWGIFAMVLRFVPYVGPILAAIVPAIVALGVDPTWSTFAWTLGLFVVVEPLIAYAAEPVLYGHITGLSPVAVIVAMTFWTSLWGPIGLLLSTPLTLCLVVIGRHVERFAFFDVVLGDQPPLAPSQVFYHYMLAGNLGAAEAQALEYLKHATTSAYFDEVIIPALGLAQKDIVRGRIEGEAKEEIVEFVREFLNEFPGKDGDVIHGTKRALCLGGRTAIDGAAAQLLAHVLAENAIAAEVAGPARLSPAAIDALDLNNIRLVCLSYMDGEDVVYARALVKRLRRRAPNIKIMLGLWGVDSAAAYQDRIHLDVGADLGAPSISQAQETITAQFKPPRDMEDVVLKASSVLQQIGS